MNRNRRRTDKGQQGFVIHIWLFMMLFVIIPMVGLAIDAGILYFIKGKLQASVDGAALGAARSLNRSTALSQQQTDATDTATRYYHANFPVGWMGVSSVPDPAVTWPAAPPATALINVVGQIDAPTWFMRILGFNSVHLAVVGQASRRNVNIMLVIDRSQSLQDTGDCPGLRSSSQLFVNSFSNNRDQLALETFGTYYNNDFAFNTNFQPALSTQIGNLVCAGFTNAAAAYSDAYRRLLALGDHNALNVLLFFTDGIPNTMTFGPAYGTGTGPALQRTASGCTASSFSGVVAGDVSYSASLGIAQATNTTYPAPSPDWSVIGGISGCHFNSGNFVGGAPGAYTSDVGCLPTTDSWGNSLTTAWVGGTSAGFPATVNTGSGACAGNVLNSTLQNVENAGINALDNAAQAARVAFYNGGGASSYPLIVYTIGFGPSVNATLLQRIANDPASPVHSTTYTDGKYLAATSANLANAFSTIAGDILRLSR
jgi:hypothetical protein